MTEAAAETIQVVSFMLIFGGVIALWIWCAHKYG